MLARVVSLRAAFHQQHHAREVRREVVLNRPLRADGRAELTLAQAFEVGETLFMERAVDPLTVRFVLSEPFAAFPTFMGHLGTVSIGIIPKHILSGQDINTSAFNKTEPIGTGPFKFRWLDAYGAAARGGVRGLSPRVPDLRVENADRLGAVL